MAERILDTIEQPKDLKRLNVGEMQQLCEELREELIEVVSENGGHLASNLGVVELTASLLRSFDLPEDEVVFDVGHQSYVFKLLTGRRERFETIRQKDGLSGFPRPYESPYDTFSTGHSSTALSSAVGLARAKQLSGDKGKVIAIIGDGAFGGGMVYEAMNSIDDTLTNLVVILNDNSMSISKSVGGISRYLFRVRTDIGYSNTKKRVKRALDRTPVVGEFLSDLLVKSKDLFRRSIYDGRLFEDFGFHYFGPVDGHNLIELNRLFKNIKSFDGPLLVHAITVKGKGFALAEENPGAYHGVGKFNTIEGNEDISISDSFSNVFGKKLSDLASENSDLCAVTAAMKYATGLNFFKRKYPRRFFDVGIAEEHAVTFCGGLAKGGKRPVFAVYSTFLQRGYDQLFQDIALDDMDVLFAVDRAGLVGEDGETHHGVFDVSIFNSLGAFHVASPSNYAELELRLEDIVKRTGPRVVRYPRGAEDGRLKDYRPTLEDFDIVKSGDKRADSLIICYGRIFAEALEARKKLIDKGIETDVLKLNVIAPLSADAVKQAADYKRIFFVEEGALKGGVNETFLRELSDAGYRGAYHVTAIDGFVRQGSVAELLKICRLDADSIVETVTENIG